MPTTSPYQNNDYQAASAYRPYRLPVNDIMKGLQAQDAFWDQGAQRVKSYYDSALGLDLTLDQNKQIRKDFMQNADKEMSKLSSMNLADPTVQQQGLNIFKPLFQDEGILYDDTITKKRNQVIADAMRYKNDPKTQGEGYNQDNLTYALQGFKEFGSQTSRGDLKDIYGKVAGAEYTPYHDVSKEYLDIAAKCKPDKMSNTSIQGLYLQTDEENGMGADKLNGCIKGALSDKAWQQLRITGSVRYGDNYQAIAQGYSPILEGSNKSYASAITTVTAEMDKKRKDGQLTPELEDAYKQQLADIRTNIANNTASLGRLKAGDYTDIKKNYSNIISQVWGNQDIGSFAQAFSYADKTHKITANAAGIAQYNQLNENWRMGQNLGFQQNKLAVETGLKEKELGMKEKEMNMKLAESLLGGKNGMGIGSGGATYQFLKSTFDKLGLDSSLLDATISPSLDSGTLVQNAGQSFDDIKNKADQFHHERLDAAHGMANILKNIVGEDGVKDLYDENGNLLVKDVYNKADQYLTAYHNTPGSSKAYASKLDDIKRLENLTNQYSSATSNVFSFMKMRDEITNKLNAHPEVKKILDESNQNIDGFFNNEFSKKTALVLFDDKKNDAVAFTPDRLKAIAKGNDSEYEMRDANIVRKNDKGSLSTFDIYDGNVLPRGGSYGTTTTRPLNNSEVRAQMVASDLKHKGYVIGEGDLGYHIQGWSQWAGRDMSMNRVLTGLSDLVKDRTERVMPLLNGAIGDVVRNQNQYGVGKVPGLANSIANEFATHAPFFNDAANFQFRPGNAIVDANGNASTTVEVYRRREKGADKNDPDNIQDSWEIMKPQDVAKQMAATGYSLNSNNAISIIPTANGDVLTVKTPYLPVQQSLNPIAPSVSNYFYGAEKAKLANQEVLSQPIKRLTGGIQVGFDAVGTGTSYNGEQNPKEYHVWFMTPDGKKEYYGVPAFRDNDITNQLTKLENDMPAIFTSYQKAQNTK